MADFVSKTSELDGKNVTTRKTIDLASLIPPEGHDYIPDILRFMFETVEDPYARKIVGKDGARWFMREILGDVPVDVASKEVKGFCDRISEDSENDGNTDRKLPNFSNL